MIKFGYPDDLETFHREISMFAAEAAEEYEDMSDWEEMESAFLREELEDMSQKVDKYKNLVFTSQSYLDTAVITLRSAARAANLGCVGDNNALAKRCSTYINLIGAYHTLILECQKRSVVPAFTSEIISLRLAGGLPT